MAQKVTKEICAAFRAREEKHIGNTYTDGTSVFLFGHEIARITHNGLEITNAGYFTAVTKERLNGLDGVHIDQEKGVWYLNGFCWNGGWTNVYDWITSHGRKKDSRRVTYVEAYQEITKINNEGGDQC